MKHKLAVVTGGGSGTGKEVARRLTAIGVEVSVWGRTEEKLRAAVHERLAVRYEVVDLADAAAVESAARELLRQDTRPSLLVHCAGVWTGGMLGDVGSVELITHLRSIVEGSVNVARAALTVFGEDAGHFVQVAAAAAKSGYPDTALNTLAKRAQDGLQEGLSRELRKGRIKISTIYPDSIADAESESVKSGTAMSYGDVADAVVFAVTASDSMDVEELILTARRSGRWDA